MEIVATAAGRWWQKDESGTWELGRSVHYWDATLIPRRSAFTFTVVILATIES